MNLIQTCTACGEDWPAGARQRRHCGSTDRQDEYSGEVALRRNGGLDPDLDSLASVVRAAGEVA